MVLYHLNQSILLGFCCAALLLLTAEATGSFQVQHCIDGDKCVNRGLLKIDDGKVVVVGW